MKFTLFFTLVSYVSYVSCIPFTLDVNQCNSTVVCPNNQCCSQYGWCGTTEAYCGTSIPVTTSTLQVNQCNTDTPCSNGMCCSQHGWCGTTEAYCGLNTLIPSSLSSTPSTPSSSLSSTPSSSIVPSPVVNIMSPKMVPFGLAIIYGIACAGAVAVLADTNVTSNIITNAAFSVGATSVFFGNVDSVGAISVGAFTTFTGNMISQAAVTLGASAIENGDIYSGAAVSLGADSKVNGNVYASAAVTIGADAVISGETIVKTAPTSIVSLVLLGIQYAYDSMMGLTNGLPLTNILLPGLYLNTGALAAQSITFNGTSLDTWIIQIIGAATFSGDIKLIGGAIPENIRWVVSGAVSISANVNFYGTIVSLAAISSNAQSIVHGKMYSILGACSVLGTGNFVST